MKIQIPRSLLKSVTLLNLGLLAIAAAGIACAVYPLMDISVNVTPPALTDPAAGQGEPTPGTHAPAYTDYALIADQNLFHPTRAITASGPALPRPEVILYGTLITDNMSIAYVEDRKSPRTTPGRGKRQIALKKGESLSGYVLTSVDRDRIELVKGGDKIVVHLSDQNKERSVESTRSASAPAVQPRAAPAPAQPAVQPRARPAAPPPAVQPRTAPSAAQPRTSGAQPATPTTVPAQILPGTR